MLECEKKILLNKDEYYAIITLMHTHDPAMRQINYYFDTDDFSLNKKGITCRIRAKDGKFKTTVKVHDVQDSDQSIELELFEKTELDLNSLKFLGLRHKGELITERIIAHKDSYCEIVLDRNTYLGHSDYELEAEYRKEYEEHVQGVLREIAESLVVIGILIDKNMFLARVGKAKPKSQRFFKRLEKF